MKDEQIANDSDCTFFKYIFLNNSFGFTPSSFVRISVAPPPPFGSKVKTNLLSDWRTSPPSLYLTVLCLPVRHFPSARCFHGAAARCDHGPEGGQTGLVSFGWTPSKTLRTNSGYRSPRAKQRFLSGRKTTSSSNPRCSTALRQQISSQNLQSKPTERNLCHLKLLSENQTDVKSVFFCTTSAKRQSLAFGKQRISLSQLYGPGQLFMKTFVDDLMSCH